MLRQKTSASSGLDIMITKNLLCYILQVKEFIWTNCTLPLVTAMFSQRGIKSNQTTQFCSLCQSNFFASCKTCIVISSERCVVLKPFVSILAFCRNSPIHFVSSEPIFSGTTAGDNERHDCIGTCKVEGLRVGMYFARILHLEWIGKRMKNKENFFWFM